MSKRAGRIEGEKEMEEREKDGHDGICKRKEMVKGVSKNRRLRRYHERSGK